MGQRGRKVWRSGMTDLASLMPAVAIKLWGEPTSRTPTEWRFGQGRTISPVKGVFSVFLETPGEGKKVFGGGVIDLVKREMKTDLRGAMQWLEANGFIEGETRSRDAGPRPAAQGKPQERIVATYDYTDETGRLVYQVCRLEDDHARDENGKPKKRFMQRQPDGRGGWTWNLQGVTPTLFRLPEVQEAIAQDNVIFVVEGEKCVEALAEIGAPATCNSGGAGKWRPEFADLLAGADVVILPDNDETGSKHATTVSDSLAGKAKRVRKLVLPGLPPKGDVADWIAKGGDVNTLYDLAAKAPEPGKEPYVSRFGAIRFCEIDILGDEHRWLIKDVLAMNEVALIVGPSQSGKSFVAIEIGMAIARGVSWYGKRVEPGLALYQAGEGGPGVKKRLRAYREHYGIDPRADLPFVLLPRRIDIYSDQDCVPSIIAEARHWISQYPESPLRVLFIDTFSKATPAADENSAKDMSMVLERCKILSEELKCEVVLVHHMNADGSKPRGHTSIFANVDSAVMVEKTMEMDGERRPLRDVTVIKNKDGGDGERWRFVLQAINLGKDPYGEDIWSCVCVEPQGQSEERPDFSTFTTDMRDAFAMVKKAVYEMGTPTPGGLTLPKSIMTVTTSKAVLELYMKNIRIVSEDAPEAEQKRVYEAARKSLQRGTADLMHRGYIGREGRWVWLTGKEPTARTGSAGGKKPRPGFGRPPNLPSDIGDFA